jgi:hypothetical protein
LPWDTFDRIWLIDFEFRQPDGERQHPWCLVAREVQTGETLRFWEDDLSRCRRPPFGTGLRELVTGYFLTAEFGCYLALGWPRPPHVIDLYVEYRWLRNDGVKREPDGTARRWGMTAAAAYFGLPTIEASAKDAGRALAMRGAPFSEHERRDLLAYCESDVVTETALFRCMRPRIDLERALLRGRTMFAFAHVEWVGVPVDVPRLERFRDRWEEIKHFLVADVDRDYGVFDEDGTFKEDRFEQYLMRHCVPWPRLNSGRLALDSQTFKDQARAYPQFQTLHELRETLGKLRLESLAVGRDGRNRVLLSPFGQKAARNNPSTAKNIFGPATWIRSLITPDPCTGLAYIDWVSQEQGIGAVLSGDTALQTAYATGDIYLAFAKDAGMVPADATVATHSSERSLCKSCVLGISYGMGEMSLGTRINQPPVYAAFLLRKHQQAYPRFWRWLEGAQSYGFARGQIFSKYGWRLIVTPDTKVRTLRNYPCQCNGSAMLHFATCFLTEQGIRLCGTVHDAVLIEAPLKELDETVTVVRQLMAKASALVLNGFELRTDATIVRWPDHYQDPRGQAMWGKLSALLPDIADVPGSAVTVPNVTAIR